MDLLTSIIPPRAKTVVEFGGDTSKKFLAVQPRAKYNIEKFFGKNQQVDCIFYHGDFFMQSLDKIEKQISEHVKYLRDDGQIAICLDNPAYIDQILAQINNTSKPINAGLNTIIQILKRLNLNVYVQPVNSKQDQQRMQNELESDFVKSLVKINSNQQIFFSQCFFIYATKTPHEKLVLQYLLGETYVTSRPRITEPGIFMKTVPNTLVLEYLPTDPPMHIFKERTAKFFIRQRCRYTEFKGPLHQLRMLLKAGYSMVTEQDDWLSLWMDAYKETKFIDFIVAHGISTSTVWLEEQFKKLNSAVGLFENQIMELPEPRNYDAEDRANTKKEVTILYAALNRWKDCQEIIPALNEIGAKYSNVKFHVAADEKFFQALTMENKFYLAHKDTGKLWIPYAFYLKAMRQADIILMPLSDNDFNFGKSDIKFIEASSQGCATIASNTVYERTIVDGKTGFIYHNPEEFKTKLETLITNPKKRREMARNAYEYVKNERMLADHYMDRINWFWDLYHRRLDLTIDVVRRLENNVPKQFLMDLHKDFPKLFSQNFMDSDEEEIIIAEDDSKLADKKSDVKNTKNGNTALEYFSGGDDL